MTGDAIHRGTVVPVALNAETHGVIHFSLGDGLRVHVAMAFRAIDARANVRRVIEFHVRGRVESVNALPWDVFTSGTICRKFLDFRLVCGDYLMAGHAEIDAGNARVRTLIDADVAIGTLHAVGEVNFVRVGDGLDRFAAPAEKFLHRIGHGAMRRSEQRRSLARRLRRCAGILSRNRTAQNRHHENDRADD